MTVRIITVTLPVTDPNPAKDSRLLRLGEMVLHLGGRVQVQETREEKK